MGFVNHRGSFETTGAGAVACHGATFLPVAETKLILEITLDPHLANKFSVKREIVRGDIFVDVSGGQTGENG